MTSNQVIQILECCRISFDTSILRGLRRTLGRGHWSHLIVLELDRLWKRSVLCRSLQVNLGQVSYDEVTELPLDPKLVADAIKEELMFMRKLQVYHEVLVNYLDKSGLKATGTRWVYTNQGDAANPFIRARLVAQETKRVSELTPEDASSTFAAALSTGEPQARSCSVDV